MGFPWNVFTSSLKYLYACGSIRENHEAIHGAAGQQNTSDRVEKSAIWLFTCWASVSDWNVMYQLLLCANSTLITFGQLSFLNSDSTSCELHTKNGLTLQVNIYILHTVWCFQRQAVYSQVNFTSTGVVSGTSLRMIMHRLWLGRTFSPFSSTCTIGEAEGNSMCLNLDKPQMHMVLADTILNNPLTSQHIQDEVHVSGEDLDALHAGYSPYRNKLVTVHLGHQVQILWEVFSELQNNKSM